jgi:hypothetical protein
MTSGKEHLLYKWSRTADKGLCCSWGLDVGLSDLPTSRHCIVLSTLTLTQCPRDPRRRVYGRSPTVIVGSNPVVCVVR